MSIEVMGVRVDEVDLASAMAMTQDFLVSPEQKFIFTPNPEMLVKAREDKYFLKILNKASLNLCDGTGLFWAAKRRGARLERIQGTDFMMSVCELCLREGRPVFLLGSGSREIVEGARNKLLEKFPGLKVVGVDSGPRIIEMEDGTLNYDHVQNERILNVIRELRPEVLFVAFGMGKQEKWIMENIQKLPSVRVAMGLGGAFDYISGKIPRAPLLMRKIGLEWLYRLCKQPRRIGRILNATVRFTYLVLKKV